MDVQRWAVIERLYHAALAKEPQQRSSYLDGECADDPTLRTEVESLLAYADAQLTGSAQRSALAKLGAQLTEDPESSMLVAGIGPIPFGTPLLTSSFHNHSRPWPR